MHMLAAQPGGFVDEEGIIDLAQTPADIVILSAADSSLSALSAAAATLDVAFPSIRLANWAQLIKPAALDLYRHKVLDHARVVVLSLLGGQAYWQYGFDQLRDWACVNGGALIIVPGDDAPDQSLLSAGSVPVAQAQMVWRYLREGGINNATQLLLFLAEQYCQYPSSWQQPQVLPRNLIYKPGCQRATLSDWQQQWHDDYAVVVVLLYRSHLQSGNTSMFNQLIEVLCEQCLNPLPVAVSSLKDETAVALIDQLMEKTQATLILNTTGFACNAVATPQLSSQATVFKSTFKKNVPILQVLMAGTSIEAWQSTKQGLRSRDIAMQVVLPEMDGRVITRVISFKSQSDYDKRCQTYVVRHSLEPERAQSLARLAYNYCRLSYKKNGEKRIALILANYPTRDGRIGNGVGLDTPASTLAILQMLQQHGYHVSNLPENGNALIEQLLGAVTNNPATLHQLPCWQSLCLSDYRQFFQSLPLSNQQAVVQRWGPPEQDPKCRNARLMLSGIRLGDVFVGIQPARGFNLDLAANYHDPDLVPPHSYLAFYFWLQQCYQVDAIIHVGKHGNLEWLPGKGSALSRNCWPDINLATIPHFYPFIVNDPGEGAQAKRRAHAVIVDHLMPPMVRAGVYGELAELETLVDEYYQAMMLDTRREALLKQQILQQARASHVLDELNLDDNTDEHVVLSELDTYLCDIKEAQIRGGLHCLGRLPDREPLLETLVALVRLPRGEAAIDNGILHNLCDDLDLRLGNGERFDPFCASADLWSGQRPQVLQVLNTCVWRSEADTRERLEALAHQWMDRYVLQAQSVAPIEQRYPRTSAQLVFCREQLLTRLWQSVDLELHSLLSGLSGQYVPPGPSGAPTRGRLDTLPTGRNFFSVDNRSIPSKTAWTLGQQSAQALIERHLQEHGDYPKSLGMSVWGTATMRTGGDDIAQAFALMGVRPVWLEGTQRVSDIEVLPAMQLGRPRVDVTLRVSGFFRDAFPNVMKLFDTAVQAIVALDEPGSSNTISQHVCTQAQQLMADGLDKNSAYRQASYRVFGSKPGAYGAGLQGLIDERCWHHREDLAQAYIHWGGYAYGEQSGDGVKAVDAFKHRLSQMDVVVHNQDNREHDILDSDDYYQFQGGMSNAVSVHNQHAPVIYHGDHSNPASPTIRTLQEELNRVIRSRVLNPKWINAMKAHGYKGAFEMCATVDYLFAYDATTELVADYQYQTVADTLVLDAGTQQFLRNNNINALEEMTERLLEAIERGMWQESGEYKPVLQQLLLELDEAKEQMGPLA